MAQTTGTPTPSPADDPASRRAGRAGRQTLRNLLLSMVVTLAFAGGWYLFFTHHEGTKDPVKTVSYTQELGQARRTAPYAVSAPRGLPEGWRATSVTYRPEGDTGATWHLGFVTPDDEYVGVEQASEKPDVFVDDVTLGARATRAEVRVDGAEWTRYEGSKRDALVRQEPGVTTVVTGTGSWAELTRMAAALQAGKG